MQNLKLSGESMKYKKIILAIVSFCLFITSFNGVNNNAFAKGDNLTYLDGVEAGEWAYSGLNYMLNTPLKMSSSYIYDESIKYKQSNDIWEYLYGLSAFSTYMATGDKKYLETVKNTADMINKILPESNLIPQYSISQKKMIDNSETITGTNGQASALQYIAYLARIDSSYIPLMDKLAYGILKHCIDQSTNLAWYRVYSNCGYVKMDKVFEYETQLGAMSVTCAEALLAAYETCPTRTEYRTQALKILKAVWNCRDKETNLIPETWDIFNNTIGKKLYPYEDFRYDDMGGVYVRSLLMAYSITKDNEILNILKTYTPALANSVWDSSINGGAFRYLTTIKGNAVGGTGVEIMYGLFTATLLEANEIVKNEDIYKKCIKHADNILMTNFGVKNNMIPHEINMYGNYINSNSDSQLGYAVIQYPLGYNMLSKLSSNSNYRERVNKIFLTFMQRHKIGDNVKNPKGYVNIIETKQPYGFEKDYSTPEWMKQAMFIPAYLLYNSIQPSRNVNIDWYNGMEPNVFGLVCDMPFWNLNNVSINLKEKKLILKKVSGKGTIDLKAMGFEYIQSMKYDGQNYSKFKDNIIETQEGTHSYEIIWK